MTGRESSAVFLPARQVEDAGLLAGDRKQDGGVFVTGVFEELADQLQHRPRLVPFSFRRLFAVRFGIESHIAFGEFSPLQIVQSRGNVRDNVGADQDRFEIVSLMQPFPTEHGMVNREIARVAIQSSIGQRPVDGIPKRTAIEHQIRFDVFRRISQSLGDGLYSRVVFLSK